MNINLSMTNRARGAVETRWLKSRLTRVLRLLKVRQAEWSITIVGDREMMELHERTMGLPTTTDVLTFDLRERDAIAETREGGAVELDTVICRDEAVRRSGELGHAAREELLLYCVHSLLHVQGHDDLRKADAARMHRREDAVLIALGVGAVYGGEKTQNTGRTR